MKVKHWRKELATVHEFACSVLNFMLSTPRVESTHQILHVDDDGVSGCELADAVVATLKQQRVAAALLEVDFRIVDLQESAQSASTQVVVSNSWGADVRSQMNAHLRRSKSLAYLRINRSEPWE